MKAMGDKIAAVEGEKWDQSVMRLNTKRFVVLRNIRNNIRRQLPQLAPYPSNPQRVAIVGGGWSLKHTVEELRQLYFDGVKLVAVNGSARWLMERNLRPSMHIVLDARPENVAFVREAIPHCKYFFASQVDGSLIDACESRDLTLFHAIGEGAEPEEARLNSFYNARWVRVPPCGTVGLTTILLLRILGFSHQHLFGLDSCIAPDSGEHHGYAQALNDEDGYATFKICEKEFVCSAWQAAQVQSFMNLLSVNGSALDLTVHGEGILSHILKIGPELAEREHTARGE